MKITMVSNAMSHHQKPFCDTLAAMSDVEFHFIATKPLADERRGLGYSDLNHSAGYIVRSYESDEAAVLSKDAVQNGDFVIFGSAPYWIVRDRLRKRRDSFLYSERIFKKKDVWYNLKLWLIYFLRYGRYAGNHVRILCASAFASGDFKKIGFRDNQFLKWGYFPKRCEKVADGLIQSKKRCSIIWVGRMISWKHPETALHLARRLKENGLPFHLTMVGNGELYESIQSQVNQLRLNDVVTLTGALPTDEVRKVMEDSEIMITTSDQNEGWGAVINEGMSSACAVCASREMGAAPFLIQDGVNGYTFRYSDLDTLYDCVKGLLQNTEQRELIGKAAAETIDDEWNGENAAWKFVQLCRKIQAGDENFAFSDGVCSKAL